MSRSPMHIWGVPVVLALSTAVGLVAALLGDGVWDWLSALTLGIPALIGAWCCLRGRAQRAAEG